MNIKILAMACTSFGVNSLGNSPTHCTELSLLYRPTAADNLPFHPFSLLLLTTRLQPALEGMSSAWVCVDNRTLSIMGHPEYPPAALAALSFPPTSLILRNPLSPCGQSHHQDLWWQKGSLFSPTPQKKSSGTA